MVAVTSRRLTHNLNELKRLEHDYFRRLGRTETHTVKACGSRLNALALHYKTHVGSQRVGLESETCKEIEDYFNHVAQAMAQLQQCLQAEPPGIRHIYHTYQHGHSAWSTDGFKRSADAKNVIMQMWHDGHAADWFLPELPVVLPTEAISPGEARMSRREELGHLATLMRRLSAIYQGLQAIQKGTPAPGYDEKDVLVFTLADMIKEQARPVLHAITIATSIHAWATGDLNPPEARFLAAYQTWKRRPLPDAAPSRRGPRS